MKGGFDETIKIILLLGIFIILCVGIKQIKDDVAEIRLIVRATYLYDKQGLRAAP